MRHGIRAICFLVSAASIPTYADAVDDYIEKQMRRQHLPGVSLAVAKDGKLIKAKGYGLANIETNTPATSETVYQLASLTKPFTASAILLLVQDGKISLDDPVSLYVKEAPDTWKDVTVRHLLTHTSGIKDYLNELHESSRDDTTPEKIIGLVADRPLNFAPGEKYAYSNTGYVLLATIVRKISGKAYDAFLTERIFKPLGMQATRRNSLDDIVPNRAAGYTWTDDEWQNSPYLNPTLWDNGDGGMLSTVLDLAKWDAALSEESLLKEEIKRQMWRGGILKDGKSFNYGFGWQLEKHRGNRLVGHGGSKPGAGAILSRYADDGITVILLTNCRANTERLSVGVARHYLTFTGFPRPLESKASPDRLSDYTGHYAFGNRILTITQEEGRLVEQLPGQSSGDWLPVSKATFFSEDLLIEMTFDRDSRDEVIGATWKSDSREKKMPRLGPLIHAIELQPDPEPGRTGKVRSVLETLATGDQAVKEAADIAPNARKDLGGAAMKDLSGLQSLTYIAEWDIDGRGVERHGEKVKRLLYYKLATRKGTRYLLVHLTAEGLVADMDIVDDGTEGK